MNPLDGQPTSDLENGNQNVPWNCIRHGNNLKEAYFVNISPRQQRAQDDTEQCSNGNGINDVSVTNNLEVSTLRLPEGMGIPRECLHPSIVIHGGRNFELVKVRSTEE